MREQQERLAALREASELRAQGRAARELRILRLAAEGLRLGEIAKRLGVSPSVVSRVVGGTVAKRPGHRGLPHGLPTG